MKTKKPYCTKCRAKTKTNGDIVYNHPLGQAGAWLKCLVCGYLYPSLSKVARKLRREYEKGKDK